MVKKSTVWYMLKEPVPRVISVKQWLLGWISGHSQITGMSDYSHIHINQNSEMSNYFWSTWQF